MRSTADQITHVLRHHFGVTESRTSPGTRFNELGFDSLDWPDFWFELEMECAVEIEEADRSLQNARTLGELAEAIDAIKAQRAA